LTQVAGRSGRGDTPGEVIVQTFTPEHESIRHAQRHDYLSFYDAEIPHRKEVGYPPFACLANFVFSDPEEPDAAAKIRRLELALRRAIFDTKIAADVLGPVACPLSRLKGKYRWHLVLRCQARADVLALARRTLDSLTVADRLGLSLDIDPLTML
jgi:primosomal protein N' (replication factor Y)